MRSGDIFEVDITFIRHGLTRSNMEKKYISYTDESLCEDGIGHIRDRAEKGDYPSADRVFVSSRVRTYETANIIYPNAEKICISTIDELNFGVFEGKDYQQLKDNADYQRWLDSNGTSKIIDGESRDEFVSRQVLGLNEILLASVDVDKVSVVCHGGTIMGLVSHYTDLDYYDCMMKAGEMVTCHVIYEIKGNKNVSISHFSIANRDNS